VHQLFLDSLVPFGVLALGRKETLVHSDHAERFEVVDDLERIYRKRPS
jgi:chemotaxis protein methyltransferase CheR